MKKTIAFLLCIVMLASIVSFAGCGKKPKKASTFDLNSLKTIGDVLALETESEMSGYNEFQYVNLFQYGGVYYRIYADLPEGAYDQMEAIDFFDEKHDEKIDAILKDIKITLAEDMTKYIPTEEYLAQYVGKTGQELLDDDFWSNGYSLYDQVFFMGHDIYEFNVYFNETVEFDENDMDDFDEEETIKSMTVKKLEFTGFSNNATNPYDPNAEKDD